MTELVNRRGVNIVEETILDMEWFFRDQPISDQGIDAHAEKAPGGRGSGRLIALQIKSGPSYFGEPTKDGWTFRFSKRKAALWLEHALPVLVVLVDVGERVGYWQHISQQTVVSTGKGFKVVVPRAHALAEADEAWSHIASGIELRAGERYDFAISQLPPHAKILLKELAETAQIDAAVLALHLAEGRGNPRATVQSLLMTSPGWLTRNVPLSWQILASYAAEHDCLDLSAEAFERSAEASQEPGKLIAAAALNLMPYDTARSAALLDAAEESVPESPLIAIGRSLLNHPSGDGSAREVPSMLLEDTDELRRNAAVQAFLSEQARRSNDLDKASYHANLALEADPISSDAMIRLAEITLRRVGGAQLPDQDVASAIELLDAACQQRREWAGCSADVLVQLLRACAAIGEFDDMLGRALPTPIGSASAQEAADPRVRRLALTAAYLAGRGDLIEFLSSQLGDEPQDNLAKLRVGVLSVTPDAELVLLEQEFQRACDDDDLEAVAQIAVELASRRVDRSDVISPLVARFIIPDGHLRLIGALATMSIDPDGALATLRSLARTDMTAAEHLIGELVNADRFADAAAACVALYESTGSSFFLIARAEVLIQAKTLPGAEEAARMAVGQPGFPHQRRKFLTFLGRQAADRGDWDEAEKHAAAVLTLTTTPSDNEVWNLVICLVRLGRLTRASHTWAQHKPDVRDNDQAVLWLQANMSAEWDEAMASEALSLAQRFNEPELSTALLSRIITGTRVRDADSGETDLRLDARRRLAQGAVPADLHRQAFAVLEGLVAEFGAATGVTVLEGSPEELLDQMAERTRELSTATVLQDLVENARDSRIPLGFLASARGGSYATLLVQRLLPLVAGSADDTEHDDEVTQADRALGCPVVIDTAALHTLAADGMLSALDGHFSALQLPSAALRDIHRAVIDIRGLAGSPGTAGWDPEAAGLVLHRLDDDEFVRQLRRVMNLEKRAESLSIKMLPQLDLLPELGLEAAHAAWLAPIQLAHDQGLTLWSDDLGLRRLARQFDVPAFGTPALIDAFRDRALLGPNQERNQQSVLARTAQANRELAADMVVDVALHLDDLVELGAETDWLPLAGALVLSRPSWWAWQRAPLDDLATFYVHIGQDRRDRIGEWQHAAMIGAAKAYMQAGLSTRILAAIALLGLGGDPCIDDIVDGCLRARLVASQLKLPDPIAQLPAAAAALAKAGRCSDPDGVAREVLSRLPAVGRGTDDRRFDSHPRRRHSEPTA